MGSIADIKHVVILMQENRSFDEYFGTFPGATGLNDPGGVFDNLYGKDANQNDIKPFRMSTFTASGLERDNASHSWVDFQALFTGGKYNTPNRWARQGHESVVGYYAANDIPFHWELARTFVLCDHFFASALSATAANRLYLVSGCAMDPMLVQNPDYTPIQPPPPQLKLWPGPALGPGMTEGNDDPANIDSYDEGQPSWSSYPDLLSKAGVGWRIYDETSLTNTIPCPNPTNGWGTMNILTRFASWNNNNYGTSEHNQLEGGGFETDCNNGNLPPVSWIIPPFWASEWENNHPSDGAAYIAQKLAAILNGTDKEGSPLWSSTVFIVIWDESGGHFDHVLPQPAAVGTPGEYFANPPWDPTQPFGPGFRVPAIVVSPWTFNQGVQQQPFDFTSILRFLELVTKNFVPPGGVPCAPNIDSWRRNTFGDLTSVFNWDSFASLSQVMGVFPWTQPYAYPQSSSPTPMLAETYAAQAFSRMVPGTLSAPSSPYWPSVTQSCEIIMEVGSYDLGQVMKVADGGPTATFTQALHVVVHGFEPNELFNAKALAAPADGIKSPTGPCTTRVPVITFSNSNGNISVNPNTITINQDPSGAQYPNTNTPYTSPTLSGVPYTFEFTYDLVFQNFDEIFPPTSDSSESALSYVVNATFQVDATFTANAELELVSSADPQFYKNFTDDTTWLSGELVVFSLAAGQTMFHQLLGDKTFPTKAGGKEALAFINGVINNLNKEPALATDFNALDAPESSNPLYLAYNAPGAIPIFNFALARVHLNSTQQASNVRVFFRSCRASVTTGAYDAPALTTGTGQSPAMYRNYMGSADTKIPMLGVNWVTPPDGGPATLEYTAIPFFASKRVNLDPTTSKADPAISMASQPADGPGPDGPGNVQTIGPGPAVAYFGCWLDINQEQDLIPSIVDLDSRRWDGGFAASNGNPLISVQQAFVNDLHQCLVAEISFDPITIPQGDVPGYSAYLAQRNLELITP